MTTNFTKTFCVRSRSAWAGSPSRRRVDGRGLPYVPSDTTAITSAVSAEPGVQPRRGSGWPAICTQPSPRSTTNAVPFSTITTSEQRHYDAIGVS